MRSNLADVTVKLIRETELAICVNDGGDKDVEKPHGLVEITAPEWLLIDKGLV